MDRRNGPVLLQRPRTNETGPLESAAMDDQETKRNIVPSDRPVADMDPAAAGMNWGATVKDDNDPS